MLQFSILLELQAHKLHWDALQVINAAISGSATTNFWNLMENFFGVDEDPSESLMGDAASMVAIMKARKAKQEKEEKAQSLSISKEEEEELLDTASTTSSVASGARPKTLSQIKSKHSKIDTYPNKCPISLAQLFFPTSQQDLHQTGIPAKYISHREGIGALKAFTPATMEIATTEHKPNQWSAPTFVEFTSASPLGVGSAQLNVGGSPDIGLPICERHILTNLSSSP